MGSVATWVCQAGSPVVMIVIDISIDPLPNTRHCAKFFPWVTSFNLLISPTEKYYCHLNFISEELRV